MTEEIILGRWTEDKLDRLLKEASATGDSGERVGFLSERFLKTRYKESTLIGGINTEEVFVINLEGLDCFTFVEYIEAMRRADSFPLFKENLKSLRYRSGEVDFKMRAHFFTDWSEFNPDLVFDATKLIGAEKCRVVKKRLNEKEDGTPFLPGVVRGPRDVTYIPSQYVDEKVVKRMKTGDYVGIYSEKEGLDVTHVGIVVIKNRAAIFRHASSPENRGEVVDEDLMGYLENRPGIIVLRPKA